MILLVTLTVRRDAAELFRRFEQHAAQVMARHGGRIERTIIADHPESPALFKEVHLIRFPDPATFDRYRSDPALDAARPWRDSAVVATDVLIGIDGPDYNV